MWTVNISAQPACTGYRTCLNLDSGPEVLKIDCVLWHGVSCGIVDLPRHLCIQVGKRSIRVCRPAMV